MAAVIRYLSADNHTADTPPFNSPETGHHNAIVSLLHRPVFERNVRFKCKVRSLCMCLSVFMCVQL